MCIVVELAKCALVVELAKCVSVVELVKYTLSTELNIKNMYICTTAMRLL